MSCENLYVVGINKITNKAEIGCYDRDTEYFYVHEWFSIVLSDNHKSSYSAEAWLKGKEAYETYHNQLMLKAIVSNMRDISDAPAKELYKVAKRIMDIDTHEYTNWDLRELRKEKHHE